MHETLKETGEKRIQHENIIEIPGLERHYNAAAWWGPDEKIILLARYVPQASPEGEIDKGPIVAVSVDKNNSPIPTPPEEVKIDSNQVLSRKEVWNPYGKEEFLEDPRAIVLPDKRVLVGLTSVQRAPNGDYIPHPSILYLPSTDEIPEIIQPHRVITEFGPGKNLVPVDSETFLFRQEGPENNHKLLVIKWDEKENSVRERGVLEFPTDLDWASFRIGTTMPPIWVNDKEALIIFHGIKKILKTGEGSSQETEKYVYSLGIAKLEKDENGKLKLSKENVCKLPILHPDDLTIGNQALSPELHPKRRVVYVCGGVIEQRNGREYLVLFVNVGDSKTVGVNYNLETLMSKFSW